MLNRIIIAHDYIEGSASSNRILGFAKGYKEQGIETIMMLYDPSGKQTLQMDGIDVHFFCESKCGLKVFRRVTGVLQYVKAIKKAYIPGRTVLHIYRTPWWGFLFNKKKYNFFFERGEIPFYAETGSFSYRVQEYLGMKVSKRATGMLAQTYSLKDYYSKVGVKNIEVINMFVDVDRFDNLTVDKSKKYIAYCGTVAKHKDGVDDMIRAFEIVHRTHSEYNLLLIGGFEALYGDEAYLRGMVKDMGLSDCVLFTGKVKPSEIPSSLQNASILALARPINKQTQYGFPTKLGEYLCTGNPIVLTPAGEVTKYLTDHETCIFAEPEKPEDFAEKLLWVIEHEDEAKSIGRAGKELIDKDFSISSQAKKAVDFMEKVADASL